MNPVKRVNRKLYFDRVNIWRRFRYFITRTQPPPRLLLLCFHRRYFVNEISGPLPPLAKNPPRERFALLLTRASFELSIAFISFPPLEIVQICGKYWLFSQHAVCRAFYSEKKTAELYICSAEIFIQSPDTTAFPVAFRIAESAR